MSNSINLVSPKSEQLGKDQDRLKVVRIIALLVMLGVALVAVLVFVINLTLPIDSIKQNEQIALNNIATQHKKLVQYSLVNDRINHLSDIIAKRQKLPETVSTILAVVPGDLSISSMQFDMKQISLIVSGGSLVSMNKLIDGITLLGSQKHILTNIIVQQLSLDVKSRQYAISIQADIK
jgi:hypothetical protein